MNNFKHLLLLLTLIATQSCYAESSLPKFNWDTVPLYAHFGDRKGMSDEEVEFIASHYDFIVLEKAHGMAKYGNTEQGTIEDVARIKVLNPQAKMLYVDMSDHHWHVALH